MAEIGAFSKVEHFDYQAMLDEAIETILSANVELGPKGRKPDRELEALLDPLRKVKEAQALFAPALTVQRLRKRDFTARGLVPSPNVARWMEDHDFYLVRVPVTLMPAFGWNFVRLKCWIGFTAAGSTTPPKVHDLYPETCWTEILKLQTQFNLGLDTSLRFRAGLDMADSAFQSLGGQAQARVDLAATSGAALVLGPFEYNVQRAEVLSTGLEGAEAFWQLDGHAYVQREEPYLAVVLRVPKKTKEIHAQGALVAYHAFDFWGAHLNDWWGDLREKLQSFFSKGLPIEKTALWENITA